MAAADESRLQEIDLMTLSIPQLHQIKSQVDQELALFQDSLETLKIAQNKFADSGKCLEKVTPKTKGADILVPLSASMYVPGKIADSDNVIIDIGTGYYMKKDISGAKDFFKRKVSFLTEQIEKIQGLGQEKVKIRDAILEVMEIKAVQQQNANKVAPPVSTS